MFTFVTGGTDSSWKDTSVPRVDDLVAINDGFDSLMASAFLASTGTGSSSANVTLYISADSNLTSTVAKDVGSFSANADIKKEFLFSSEEGISFADSSNTYWCYLLARATDGSVGASVIVKVLVDNATYTWQADSQGAWDGSWDDPAHWQASAEPNYGYPRTRNSTAQFGFITTEQPVTVYVSGVARPATSS